MSELKEKLADILFSIDKEHLSIADTDSGNFIEEMDDRTVDFSHFQEYEVKKNENDGSYSPCCSFMIFGGDNGTGNWGDYLDELSEFCIKIEDQLELKPYVYKIETDLADDVWYAYMFLYSIPEDLKENIETHEKLNLKIWNEDNEIIPEVKSKIIQIVDEFRKLLALDDVDLKVEDIYLLGSNANYNYNEDSDLDVHIIADESFDCSNEHLPIIYNAYKTLFNNKYELTIKGINVEIYVENKEKLSNVSSGVYSFKDGWIKKPTQYKIPDVDQTEIDKKVQLWEDKYYSVTEHPTIKKIEDYLDSIYEMRIDSIQKDGEFGIGNLVFKEIRRLGYLEDLKQLKIDLTSKELSLESLEEGYRQDLYDRVVKLVNFDLTNGYKDYKYPEKMNDKTLDEILGDMSDERLEKAIFSRNAKGKSPNWCGKLVANDRPWTWLLSEVISKLKVNENLNEKMVETDSGNKVYLDESPYPVRDYMLAQPDVVRIFWWRTDYDENVYGYGDGLKLIHLDIVDVMNEYYYSPYEDDEEATLEKAALVFYPTSATKNFKDEKETGGFMRPTDKGYFLEYYLKEGVLVSDDLAFEKSSLYEILKPYILKRVED